MRKSSSFMLAPTLSGALMISFRRLTLTLLTTGLAAEALIGTKNGVERLSRGQGPGGERP